MTEELKRDLHKTEEKNTTQERTKEEKLRRAYKVVNETLLKGHKFWSKEPLGKNQAEIADAALKKNNDLVTFDGLEMRSVELLTELPAVSTLLMDHYVEDAKSQFSLQYSAEFLRWQLGSPSVYPEWNLGLFDGSELVGFISAAAINIKIKEEHPKTAVVNFLCIHKEYRKRRLAPALIKEITKRVNEKGIYTALFTSGDKLPYIFTRSRYYHRILKEEGLVESGFCNPDDVEKISECANILQDSAAVQYRRAAEEELPDIYEMYCNKYRRLDISAAFTYDQFKYYVYGREGLTNLLISSDKTEFVSMFFMSTKSFKSGQLIKTAYLSYHNMKNGVESMQGVIDYLKTTDKCNVLNALEIENNTKELLKRSGFLRGDGVINYYLFNWDTELIHPSRNSFISS